MAAQAIRKSKRSFFASSVIDGLPGRLDRLAEIRVADGPLRHQVNLPLEQLLQSQLLAEIPVGVAAGPGVVQGHEEIQVASLRVEGASGCRAEEVESAHLEAAAQIRQSDPVLFNETERFRPVIFNNLKGKIAAVSIRRGQVEFDVALDRPLTEFDVVGSGLEWVEGSTVRFSVYDYGTTDDDDDSTNSVVPFQVAYAVSIHKAQGLEYDSVKVVITDANEDHITHSIFYTAVTRARQSIKIYWTPEIQQAVLQKLRRNESRKDVALLSKRRGLTPVAGRGRAL